MKKVACILGFLVLMTAGTAQAQSHEGFWVGFGLGGGSLGVDGGTSRDTGVMGYLKLGTTVSERLLLGVESNIWRKNQSGATVSHHNFSAVAYFYPSTTNGFFLKAGLGWSRLSVEVLGITGSQDGGGGVFGVGYDVLVGDNWSITPVLNLNAGAFSGGNTNISELGVGVSWH